MKIVSVILARGGSKGIPKKNIIKLKDNPLISYVIKESLKSNVNETWVCTDDSEIGEISKIFGAKVLYRPSELALDNSKSEESLLFFSKNIDFDIMVFIQPTSPLLTYEYINKGIDLILEGKYESVFSAYKEHWLPRWTISENPKPINWEIGNRPMRQDMPETFVENGAFYIISKNNLLKNKLRYNLNVGIIDMPYSKSFQVDSNDDLEIIKKMI